MFVQLLTADGRHLWVNPAHVEMFCPDRNDPMNESVVIVRGEDYHVCVRAVNLARMLREAQGWTRP